MPLVERKGRGKGSEWKEEGGSFHLSVLSTCDIYRKRLGWLFSLSNPSPSCVRIPQMPNSNRFETLFKSDLSSKIEWEMLTTCMPFLDPETA